ncbi:MAG: NifU-like protein [Chloroflexi bacterium ADurb.Bin325]|nr:MAG: NifU-like protein [Chloroflexi bacterium ADurb.Bin325]
MNKQNELDPERTPHDVIELRPFAFSAKALQHGRHPTNARRMERADAQASKVGWCGEVMEMYIRLDEDRIVEASFWADGCLSTMACGDMLTTMVAGKSLAEAAAITPEELIAALDGLPFKSHHCAELSVETLREAIEGCGGRE